MYNRYVPQSDGSYRRSRMEEQRNHPTRQTRREDHPPVSEVERRIPERAKHENQNIGGFFKQLLPPDFDTGDLIIVLLLLLLAGDCQEDKTTAMLTLVLYLFM